MSEHSDLFRSYIVQGLEHLCEEIEACRGQIPEHLQRNAFHLMKYAFAVDAAWQPLRQLLLQMAPKITLAAIPDDWLYCLRNAMILSESKNDPSLQGNIHLQLGYVSQRNNQFTKARAHYQEAGNCFALINEVREYAWSLSRTANVQRMLTHFEDAEANLEKAARLLPCDDPYLVLTFMVWGWIEYDKGRWSASQEYFEFALRLSQRVGDRQREAHLLRDIGTVLQMQSQFELSIKSYKQAINLLEEQHQEYELAVAEMNLGCAYLVLEQWGHALEWLARAHVRFQKFTDLRHIGMNYINQAIAIRGLGLIDKAIEQFQAAVSLFEILEEKFGIANGLDEIGVTYLQIHEKEKARKFFESALEILLPLLSYSKYEDKYQEILRHLDLCNR